MGADFWYPLDVGYRTDTDTDTERVVTRDKRTTHRLRGGERTALGDISTHLFRLFGRHPPHNQCGKLEARLAKLADEGWRLDAEARFHTLAC